jgi:TRAP-type C4-dicarboxylate transport system permease small subunit
MSGGSVKQVTCVPILGKIDNMLGQAEKFFSVLVFICMLALMILQVVCRYFLKIGVPWVEELIRFMFIATSFVAAAYLSKDRDHIVIDIINTPIFAITNGEKKGIVDRSFWLVADLLSLFITVLVTYRCHIFTRSMYRTHQYSPSMQVPIYTITLFMEIGFVLMIIHYLIKVIDGFCAMRKVNSRS